MEKAAQSMIENLSKNTGKSLEQWIKIVKSQNLAKHGEVVTFLKTDHGLTHGFANLIAHKAKGSDAGSAENTDDLVSAQYTGKEHFRPLYDQLISEISGFGTDIEIAPKKTYVSIRRKKQFAILKPATKTRFELELNLKDQAPTGKLEAIPSKNAMCSHVIKLAESDEVNDEVKSWLQKAYSQAG